MRQLILVKHAQPHVKPELPAHAWHLADAGRLRCRDLAARLSAYAPQAIIASREPKAAETGQIVASVLGKPFETAENLHEHDRRNAAFFASDTEFAAQVARFFDHPQQLVFGSETADEAHRRFAGAVAAVSEQHPDGNLAIVTHGTVLTLFVARANNLAPFPFWQRLGLPSFAVLSSPEMRLLTVVEQVGPTGPVF